MPAYATQTAPKQTQNSQQQSKKQKPEAPKGLAIKTVLEVIKFI